ncbi:MAG: DNA cytosine methyltransferase [Phycisphaerales bacterium]|nr:DNA cytosine methyltransferase [Phycisphaerales bacterium]
MAGGESLSTLASLDSSDARFDVVDLFCGCGGFSAGFRMLSQLAPSYRLAGALDIDPDAAETFQANLGLAPLLLDAHQVAETSKGWDTFRASLSLRPGNDTIVIGGPPCQGFTSHKQDIDAYEHLNALYVDFARTAVRLNPAVVIMENVPELVTTRSWPFYKRAVDILRRAGLFVRTRIYNLAGFGVPQERFRCVTMAMRRPFSMPEPFLARDRFRTVRGAIGRLPFVSPGVPSPRDPEHVTAGHRDSTVKTIAMVPKDGGRRPPNVGPECLRRLAKANGRSGFDDVYGRLWWDRPSVTITGSSRNPASGRFAHPEQDRGLSIREAALLQGFPRGYRFAGTLDSRFLQVGNAVPPSFAAFLAAHVLAELLSPHRTAEPDCSGDVLAPVGTSFSRLIAGIKKGHIAL